MKNLFLIITTIAFFISCKNLTDNKTDALSEKDTLVTEKTNKPTELLPCGTDIIYVDVSKIPASNQAQWNKENALYVCDSVNTIKTIDVSLFKSSSNLADWLSKNGSYIDYSKSYATIGKVHDVPQSLSTKLTNAIDVFTLTQITNVFNTSGNNKYAKYIHVAIDKTTKKTTLTSIDKHTTSEYPTNNYSLPFFEAMADGKKDPIFSFAYDSAGVIYVKTSYINGGVKQEKFSDVTHNPMMEKDVYRTMNLEKEINNKENIIKKQKQ